MQSVSFGNKKGFTIVELVIVIAVIAILAAVLVPAFSTVVTKAKHSGDVQAVSTMNKMLAAEEAGKTKVLDYEKVCDTIEDCGYSLPKSPESKDCTFYWLPDECKVVLYDLGGNKVDFPNELSESHIKSNWVDLSVGRSDENPVVPDEPYEPDEPEIPDEPETKSEYYLCSGTDFNKALKGKSPKKIVFGKKENYSGIVSSAEEIYLCDGIKAYADGNDIYVLSGGKIIAPENASGMFKGMTSLENIDFLNFDTSCTNNMNSMFERCNALTELDLSKFNTSKVKNMQYMFAVCTNLEHIYIKSGSNGWTVAALSSGKDMFSACQKLPNYSEPPLFPDKILDILSEFTSIPESSHDIDRAHSGDGGYLEEKV